ncbi:hypothetical protein BBJ28_00003210 [Nothophytophthora sp. Chile5]|nr:hypothetical protein BBJ28_00003210 [Nothophytophthora sp. Chile5]
MSHQSVRVATLSTGTQATLESPPKKKRKSTYLVRKEEADALQTKVKTLRNELATLQSRNDGADNQFPRDIELQEAAAKNQLLRQLLREQQGVVAAVQSLISSNLEQEPDNPMYTYIHLPEDWSGRREAILGMKDDKINQAFRYVKARSRHLDLLKAHFSEERYEDLHGDFLCHRFDVIHFPGVNSLKEVFDALVFFLFNMEISISEKLGHITVREDYDSMNDDAYISNHRLVSNHENGVISEVNAIAFAQYFECHEEFGSQPCALITTDSVDEDDLHPYDSLRRVRRDISAAAVLTEERRRKRSDGEAEELVVVMRRAMFAKAHRPAFEVPSNALLEVHDGIASWADVMLQTIRGLVYSRSP